MTDREKLIALIWHRQDCGLTHNGTGQDFVTYNAELADHLLANGVVVREKGEWDDTGRFLFADGSLADESAKRGIATHYFMQFFDLSELERVGAERELSRLVKQGFISKEDEGRVRIREIEMFLRSNLFMEMKNARRIFREFRFNLPFPADSFTADEEKIAAYKDESILVQGVIDCIIERADGSIGLCDYKTDRLTREELSDRSLAEARLREKHSEQLKLYAVAVEKIFGKAPQEIAVYSLPLGDTVDIK
jgi:ATP-dependent helicase/nuclease subunit A